ncbi:DMT family transporter [uncultured Clostridium sp.]|uniref:DMT family transporter n=1 Tax=uncultured Clostridium sp. TaxID=59620 RepID=UPI0025E1B389|nr:DMT family transporter [uncultured Clostridium sp.]
MLYILIAILSGVTIVISRIVNANLADKMGLFQSTFYNFLTGLLFSSLILFFANENFDLQAITSTSVPFYAYIGGIIGIFSISLSNYVAPKISAFYMTLLIFIGQIGIGIFIDYLVSNEVSIGKIIGGILVAIGLSYNLSIDKKSAQTKPQY